MSNAAVPINKLHLMALKLSDELTTDDELRNIDITDIYYDEKEHMLSSGELINAQFHGLPGSGKSTAMLAEVHHTNQLLGQETRIDHILPNQIVYIQVMRRIKHPMHVCIGVDEFDELGETGYNATTDKAGLNSYSDLGRAYYIHRYVCSPKDTLDKNAYLIFNVVGADKIHKFTRCLLSYKLFKGGMEREQLLGYVDIDVSAVLGTSFYKEYEFRKMQRLRLFSDYGIVHERHIFFAEVLLDAYAELRELAQYGKIEKGMAELQIDMSARKYKQINSILGTSKFTSDLLTLLQYVQFEEKQRQIIRKLKANPNSTDASIAPYTRILEHLCQQEQKVLDYWKRASTLKQYYISTLGDHDNHDHTPHPKIRRTRGTHPRRTTPAQKPVQRTDSRRTTTPTR